MKTPNPELTRTLLGWEPTRNGEQDEDRAGTHEAMLPHPEFPWSERMEMRPAAQGAFPDTASGAQDGAPLVACWAMDLDGTRLAWVDDRREYAGGTAPTLPLQAVMERLAMPADAERALDDVLRSVLDEVPHRIEYRQSMPDGSIRRILQVGRIARGSGPVQGKRNDRSGGRMIAACYDVTDGRKPHEQSLCPELAAIESLAQGSLQGILIHRNGVPLFANEVMAETFGYNGPNDFIAGASIRDLLRHGDPAQDHDCESQLLRGERPECRHSFKAYRKDGSEVQGETRRRVLHWAGLRVIWTTVLPKSGIAELEAELADARRMQAVAALTGGMAHDLNNLLQIIVGHATLLSRKGTGAGAAQQGPRMILEASERGMRMIRKLLAIGRGPQLHIGTVDVQEVAERALELITPAMPDSQRVCVQRSCGTPPALCDAEALEQILINLLANARDAMPEGGETTLLARPVTLETADCDTATGERPGAYVELSVTDSGRGIAPDDLPRIFEPYFTTKCSSQGSGLGLSMVRSLVDLQRGFIRVESRPGVGTTVRVYLPAGGAHPESVAELGIEAGSSANRPTVLVVEPNARVAELMARMLAELPCDVRYATTGEQALRQLENEPGGFAAVLLTTELPDVTSIEVFRQLREQGCPAEVVLVADGEPDRMQRRLIQEERLYLLRKPFALGELLHVVRHCLTGDGPKAIGA